MRCRKIGSQSRSRQGPDFIFPEDCYGSVFFHGTVSIVSSFTAGTVVDLGALANIVKLVP